VTVVDPKDNDSDRFKIGDGDEDDREDPEEARQWKQAREPALQLQPKYGLDGEAFENVWGDSEPAQPPAENP